MLNLQTERVFLRSAFDLRGEWLSVDRTLDRDIIDSRFAGNRIVFAIDFDDGSAMATHRVVYLYLRVVVVAIGVKCDDGVGLSHFHVIAR